MKAVIKLDVPKYQIGQPVHVYFKDTMMKKGVCEKEEPGDAIMRKKTVFISLPMSGRKEEDILNDIELAKQTYLIDTRQDEHDIYFVNNLERGKTAVEFEKNLAADEGCYWVEPERMPVWYLGIALCNLADADEVIFYGDWKNAKGCRIEEKVCEEYSIPMFKIV